MKKMNKARVVYNPEQDTYDIEIKIGGQWVLETGYFCRAITEGGDTTFIHWTILAKLRQLQELGYTIDFLPDNGEA